MAVIKGGKRVADTWLTWTPDTPLPDTAPILVDVDVWTAEKNRLLARGGSIGVRLASGQDPDPIADDLDRLALIDLHFDAFTDGRAFTHARQLRLRLGFKGELRASGAYLRDQAFFLARCGVDAFEIADDEPVEPWQQALASYTVTYQPAADGKSRLPARRGRNSNPVTHDSGLTQRASVINSLYENEDTLGLLKAMIQNVYRSRIAVVSSFGAESAVLLDLVAQVDRATPVIFLETGKHFPETLAYRDSLVAHLGLTDVRSVTPDFEAIANEDPDGTLWASNPDRCCALRKVVPLENALQGFDAWISGLKRFHGAGRGDLSRVDADGGRIKINPLAQWSEAEIAAAFNWRDLPRHPLTTQGYRSIGCAPCTAPVTADNAPRDGRWTGSKKTECGIHRATS